MDPYVDSMEHDKAGDVRNVPHTVLKEFIETYKNHPALWQVKNKEVYNNKKLKYRGWQDLAAVWKRFDGEADVKTAKAKIQSLRGSFRKEMRKVEKSRESGNGIDDLYVPQLWYFNLLSFVVDQEMSSETIYDMVSTELASETEAEKFDDACSWSCGDNVTLRMAPENINDCSTSSEPINVTRKKLKKWEEERRQVLQARESENEAFAAFITKKMDKVEDELQKMYAENLMNKIACYAALGKLTEHSNIVSGAF